MAEKHLKKCSTFVVIREMQIKRTLRFHLTINRKAKIKNSKDSTCWKVVEQGEHISTSGESANSHNPPPEINLVVSQKTRDSFTSRLSYTTPEHIPKRFSTIPQGHFLN
jgi:hypothetical protein